MSKRVSYFRVIFNLALCFLAASCYRRHLYVQQEMVDANYLASSKVETPDPRQENPPRGQRLLIGWDFPKSLFQKELTLLATVRLWDQTEQEFSIPVERKRDAISLYFPDETLKREKRILTYRVQVVTKEGELLETWEHHFWTELIDLDLKKVSSPSL